MYKCIFNPPELNRIEQKKLNILQYAMLNVNSNNVLNTYQSLNFLKNYFSDYESEEYLSIIIKENMENNQQK